MAGLVPGIGGLVANRLAVTPEEWRYSSRRCRRCGSVAISGLVLLGVLALRAAVIFSVQ